MPVDMNACGARIVGLRRDSGYTQEELGAHLGVTAQAISKWERGLSLPDTDLLPQLADALGASVDTLLGRGGDARPTAYERRGVDLLDKRGFRPSGFGLAWGWCRCAHRSSGRKSPPCGWRFSSSGACCCPPSA